MPQRLNCPWCERALRIDNALQAPHVTCPNCLRSIPNPAAPEIVSATASRPRPATLDTEVDHDTKGTGCGLIVLAVLGGLGIVQMALGALSVAPDDPSFLIALAVGLVFLALVSVGVVAARSCRDPRAFTFGRVVFGMLAIYGGLMLGAMALGILFVVVCFTAVLSGGLRL